MLAIKANILFADELIDARRRGRWVCYSNRFSSSPVVSVAILVVVRIGDP